MTQGQLAERLQISRAAVSQFESGISRPSLLTLQKLHVVLGYDFSPEFYKDEPINQKRRQLAEGTELLVEADFEVFYVQLPFVPRDKYEEFIELRHQEGIPSDSEWVWIPRMENTSYDDAVILEVQGNKMSPRYPEKSRHVIRIVTQEYWPYSSGVHLIALKNKMVILRRIVKNSNGSLELISDTAGEKIDVLLTDVDYMWRVGECTFIPAED